MVISNAIQRIHLHIQGIVQGVGFRPFVYRLASELNLKGWIVNSTQGVTIEIEGPQTVLEQFQERLQKEKPYHALIQTIETTQCEPVGFKDFSIRSSDQSGEKTTLLLPDIATCPDCLNDIFDPSNRRYLYPFTNCTNCGPRFTIIHDLPYDRAQTSMKSFEMCPQCREEYTDPTNRRFHAQPNACPQCGPELTLWDKAGNVMTRHHQAILQTIRWILEGKILAIKGLGGFHLMVDARNESAIQELRKRKHREEKPFALMFPSIEMIETYCTVSEPERKHLQSPEAPIVLLDIKDHATENVLASSIAPGNPSLGCMLPYTPLHHILMRELNIPIVATSGNLSDEPICIDENEALERLSTIADYFLVHNRPIVRHADDSVIRIIDGERLTLRRARGYAPYPVYNQESLTPLLAVGGHLKNTVTITHGHNFFISQHIGDLETRQSCDAFLEVSHSLQAMYEIEPQRIACDLHPDYWSTHFAQKQGIELIPIQHHFAHVAACMAEHALHGPVLGVSWDGTGFGTDNAIWGGEFLLATLTDFERVAHFRYFPLPTGDKAVKEPRRTALGLLYELYGDDVSNIDSVPTLRAFEKNELNLMLSILSKRINSPLVGSVGRLFDAVASLIGLRQRVAFEGQGAMELEFASQPNLTDRIYPYTIDIKGNIADFTQTNPWIIDWKPMIEAILNDVKQKQSTALISTTFHNTLVEIIVDIARKINQETIVVTGGCFQNRFLTSLALKRLQTEGFKPYRHKLIPPNDGGISLGQAVIAHHRSKNKCV